MRVSSGGFGVALSSLGVLLVACSSASEPDSEVSSVTQALWASGVNIGGSPNSAPAIASWAPGRLDLFYMSSRGTLLHSWFQNRWSSEEDLGGALASAPAAVSWGPGRLDVFAKGTSGDLQHIWHENGWHSWESLGGTLTSGPGVASWAPGRLDVFYANSASALGHVWYDGAWHSHQQLGSETISGSPAAVSWSNGRIDVVARGTAAGNPLIHKWYQGTWGSWETLGGSMATSPAIASWGPGRLDIFYLDSAQTLRTQWFNGTWHAEAAITGETYSGQPSAVSWGGERIDVVVKSSATGAVQRTWTPSLTRDVLTQHNDNWRSGAALKETELTPSAVSSRMGLLYTLPVSGTIYAQPLYVEGVTIGGVSRNVVYVATLANEVYAFNAASTSTTPLWHTTLESARPNEGNLNLGDLTEPSGLLATPVIDRASNSLYLVDATGTGSSAIFYLHKLDLRTGLDVVSRVA